MQTQDLKYIKYKHQMERKKIDKIQSSSHLIDSEYRPAKSHIFFVDSQKQGFFYSSKKIIFFFFLKYKSKI
jgi:U3 small nucleolar RNA-associated protein 11